MKIKRYIILFVTTSFGVLFAQTDFVPKQGNWGLTLDVAPFIKSVANYNSANAPLYSTRIVDNPNSIIFRYFLKDEFALRGRFRLGYTSTTINSLVPDAANTNPIDVVYLEESVNISQYNIGIFGGVEKRRTLGRVQGYYGGEAGLSFGQGFKYTYTYANPISVDNPTPESSDFSSQILVDNVTSSTRVLENNQGYIFSFVARGLLGAEFFIAQNFSAGFEYAWGIDLSSKKDAVVKEEYWDSANASLANREQIFKGASSFGFDNHQLMLSVNLYF